MSSQNDLLHVIAALHASSRCTCRLHCWQQQANQNPNDCDNNQELDQRESTFRSAKK
jgi:hypothetical protein